MGESMITRRGGGGGKLNALVEQYQVAAGGNVSANGFVKFVDDVSTHSLQYNYPYVSACALDDTTVLVACKYSSNKYIYCILITFAGGTATVGTRTQVGWSLYGQDNTSLMRLIRINATTAVLFFAYFYNNNYWKYAVITIADGAISSGGTKTLEYVWAVVPDNEDVYSWDVIPIGDDKFIWLDCAYDSELYLYARVLKCDASQNVITVQRMQNTKSIGGTTGELAIVASKLSDGRYVVLREYSTSYSGVNRQRYIQLHTVTDSGSAISISAATQLLSLGIYSTGQVWYATGITQITKNKLLCTYVKRTGTETQGYLYGMVITVPTSGIATVSTETQLSAQKFAVHSSESYDYNYVLRGGHGGIFKIESGYQIILKPNASEPAYAIDISVSGDTITPTNERLVIELDTTQVATKVKCDIAQPSDDRRIIYTTIEGVLTGTMLSTAINAATSGTVDGVAKDNASAGETVNVYRPA